MMPFSSRWWFGPQNEPLQYLSHVIMLAASLLYLFAGPFNLLTGAAHPVYSGLLLMMGGFYLLLWYLSRWKHCFHPASLFFYASFTFIAIPANWFFNAGAAGPTWLFMALNLMNVSVILRDSPLMKRILQISLLFMPLLLIGIELAYPESVYPYLDTTTQLIDWFVCYLVVCGCLFLLLNQYGQRFKAERDRAENLAEELRFMSNHDQLTGLYNRHALISHFQVWSDQKPTFCLALLDLDHFKQLNDLYGHGYGDEVLKQCAAQLDQLAKRHQGCATRHGGEEFVCLFPSELKQAETWLLELQQAVQTLPLQHGPVTFSAGLVEKQPQETLDQLLHRADLALYQAKSQGRNRVICV